MKKWLSSLSRERVVVRWLNETTFTQLNWKFLKCNTCWEKVTRKWVNTHKASHDKNTNTLGRASDNINKKISIILEDISRLTWKSKSQANLMNLLGEANISSRVDNILKRVAKLPLSERFNINPDISILEDYK